MQEAGETRFSLVIAGILLYTGASEAHTRAQASRKPSPSLFFMLHAKQKWKSSCGLTPPKESTPQHGPCRIEFLGTMGWASR